MLFYLFFNKRFVGEQRRVWRVDGNGRRYELLDRKVNSITKPDVKCVECMCVYVFVCTCVHACVFSFFFSLM